MFDEPRPTIGVVGAGTMGGGIAQVAALAGYEVAVQDVSAEMLDRGRQRFDEDVARRIARGRLDPAAADAARRRLRWVPALDALAASGVVIEAAPRNAGPQTRDLQAARRGV